MAVQYAFVFSNKSKFNEIFVISAEICSFFIHSSMKSLKTLWNNKLLEIIGF